MSYHQIIYNLLRGYGLSESGALGMLGNWECESNCEPYRVQGDFQPSRAISKAYVAAIENGTQDRERFATDQKGFGLAQWTYPQRKRNLWDAWKKSGQQIDSCELQVSFAMWELQTEHPGLLEQLKHDPLYGISESINFACMRICKEYERPAVNNVRARYEAALQIRRELDLTGQMEVKPSQIEVNGDVKPYEQPAVFPDEWPPRMIDKNMDGMDVVVLKAVLSARGFANFFAADSSGYLDGQTDLFDDKTEKAVKRFQSEYGLEVDGVVGPKTWAKLLDRG